MFKKLLYTLITGLFLASCYQSEPTSNRRVWADSLITDSSGTYVNITSKFFNFPGYWFGQSAKDTIGAIARDSALVDIADSMATERTARNAAIGDASNVLRSGWLQSIADSNNAYFPVTNANLAGSITDSKLNQITTASKVAGSAVQLNATGGITNSTGLKITPDGSTVELNSNTLRIKDAGVSWNKLNTATKDSIRLYSAGTLNVTNNADDTTTVEVGNLIKIKDPSLRYQVMTKYNTGYSTSANFRAIAASFKTAEFYGFDTSYVYKISTVYRADGTGGYKIYLVRALKSGGAFANLTSIISTSTVTENSDGITFVEISYGAAGILGVAKFGINYNEWPAGTSFSLATAGTYIFSDAVINASVTNEEIPDSTVTVLKSADDNIRMPAMTYISGQTAGTDYKVLAGAIKSARMYNFNTNYYYKIRNFYINYLTFGFKINLEYVDKARTQSWTTITCDSVSMDTVRTDGVTEFTAYYSNDRYIDFIIDYRELTTTGTFYYYPTTQGRYVFKDECHQNNDLNLKKTKGRFNIYTKGLGTTSQGKQSAVNTFIGIMKKEDVPYKIDTYAGKREPKKHSVNDNRKYVAVGWADEFTENYNYIAPIMNKYGVTNTFYKPERPVNTNFLRDDQSYDTVQKQITSGGDLQHHGYIHFNPIFVHASYDGYTYPTNHQLRTDYGSGKNMLGRTLTEAVKDLLSASYWTGYPSNPWYNDAWEDLSDGACDTLRMDLSVFRRPKAYTNATRLLESLDYLSNRYLGTTGYGRRPVGGLTNPTLDIYGYPTYTDSANWNEDSTAINGGIFQGCATTENHEIWERILQIEEAWQSEVYDTPVKYTFWSNSGGADENFLYHSGSVAYFDSAFSDTASIYTKLTSSLTGNDRSLADVLREFGIKMTMHAALETQNADGRTRMQYHYPLKLNSKALGKTEDIDMALGILGRYINYNYLSAGEWTAVTASDSVLKYMYELDKADGRTGTSTMIELIVKYNAWGLIPVFVDDAGQGSNATKEANFALWIELRSQFCKLAGIDEIGFGEAAEIAFNQTVNQNVNYFPNPNFDKTIDKIVHPTGAYAQTIPDGWDGGTVAYNDTIGFNVFTVTSGATKYTRTYFIQPGSATLKFKAQGTGKLKVYYLQNNDAYTLTAEPSTVDYDSVNISSSGTWTDYSLDYNIPIAPKITSPEENKACNGLDNQICGLQIVLSGIGNNVRIANPRMVRN